ncbi:selenium cofactor biosynthesis protein YqeC [Anaerolineales bacterium HSG24]|nr:selenium cofactor biosynthesis protein YqeC [Anaerolineales bacterium HSG24]
MKIAQAIQITQGDVVAFVGGGGKTSAMFQLARELPSAWRVLVTTTTRIFVAQIKQTSTWLTHNSEEAFPDLLTRLEKRFAISSQVLLIGHADQTANKTCGIEPSLVDWLSATGRFDAIIVEADGARMRPFKTPASYEPVIPTCATIVMPVIGLDVIGQPLHPDHVHRAELVSQLTETPFNEPVSIQTVAQVLSHAQGGLKNVPHQAKVIPLLNKVDGESDEPTTARLPVARQLAREVLQAQRISAVAIGQVRQANQPILECHARIAAVILAAGGSSRFDSPKQLALWQGQSLLERAVETALAASVDAVIVVLGAETMQSEQLLSDYPVQVVINHGWAKGQSSSMQVGLTTLPKNINGVLFMLVDLPSVTPSIIDQLVTRYRQTLAPIVWPEFKGQRGNPVLFDRAMFAKLHTIQGDQGGRAIISTHQHVAERVAVSHDGILRDIDYPEDLET